MSLSNVLSGSGGKYDTTKEDEVKKVLYLTGIIFLWQSFIHELTVTLISRLFYKVSVYYTVSSDLFFNILFFFQQIQAKLKAQMVWEDIIHYYMARQSRCYLQHSDWLFLGQNFAIWTVSMEMVMSCIFFCFLVPCNK